MNDRKKRFLENVKKTVNGENLLPQNIHKNVTFYEKETYSSLSVKQIVLAHQAIFFIFYFFFILFIKVFKRKPALLIKIYEALYRAPSYGCIIFNINKIAWIDETVEKHQISKEEKILLVSSLCMNYNKKSVGYNHQKSLIDIVFFYFFSFSMIFIFIVKFMLFFYYAPLLSYKTIVLVLLGILNYYVIKYNIFMFKIAILEANQLVKKKNYFFHNLS